MPEIIDLSQEIFPGMPVFPGLPEVEITVHVSHEQWDGITDSNVVTPAVNRLEMGEHTGTHVDAIQPYGALLRCQPILAGGFPGRRRGRAHTATTSTRSPIARKSSGLRV